MKLFTGRELTLFLSVFFIILAVSILIPVSISLVKRKAAAGDQAVWNAETETDLQFDDFLIPESYSKPYHMDPVPWREPAEQWDEDMADRFRQDVPALILDIIRKENTARLLEGK